MDERRRSIEEKSATARTEQTRLVSRARELFTDSICDAVWSLHNFQSPTRPALASPTFLGSDPVPSPLLLLCNLSSSRLFRFRVNMLRELLNLSDFSLHGISVFFRSSRCHHYSIRYASLCFLMVSSLRTVHTRLRANRKASADNLFAFRLPQCH